MAACIDGVTDNILLVTDSYKVSKYIFSPTVFCLEHFHKNKLNLFQCFMDECYFHAILKIISAMI